MDPIDTIAVVGACEAERQRYALRLAAGTRRMLIPASRLEFEASPAHTAVDLAPWSDQPGGVVIEYPATISSANLISAFADPAAAARLVSLICVIDAAQLLDELAVEDFLVFECNALGQPTDYVARASLTVTQLEYASMVVFVGWEPISTPELSMLMALVSALNPRARLRLDQGGIDTVSSHPGFTPGPGRAGWVSVLNDDADPHMTDPRVRTLHYEQLRPFHPERLSDVLMRRFDADEFGRVLRSAGFCRFATRPQATLHWDHVGRTIAFHLVCADDELSKREELLAVGQDLAFIGLDLDRASLTAALDEASLTDAELAAGHEAWQNYLDPFPSWSASENLAE